jgi:autotransporter-associated beta strand protein
LVKDGAGILTLSATNSYTGATTVSQGTLLVSGSILTSSLVSVSSGATLGGGGTVGALSFDGGAFFDLALAIGGNDLTASTINFATTGFGIDNLVFNGSAVDWSTIIDGTYTLIGGTLTSTNLANFGIGSAYDIGSGRSAYFQNGSLQLVVQTIPEPKAALLGVLGVLLLLRRRRN